MSDPSGLIGGRYQPLDTLGEGGQGQVLRCLDTQHDRIVALKIRTVSASSDRDYALAEARTLLTLTPHPSIAVVRDDFFTPTEHVLVMEHVDGEDLAERLRRSRHGLPSEQVLTWAQEIADALDHLHRTDPPVVHGDVKPANIVVPTGGGPAVLVDFGLAGTEARSRATRHYAAPELAHGRRSPASDVYALAASVSELLTGRRPGPDFDLRTSDLPPSRHHEVTAVLGAALAADPARRTASAGAFAGALRAAGDGPPIGRHRAIASAGRVAGPIGAAPLRMRILAAMVVALLASGVVTAAVRFPSSRERDVSEVLADDRGRASVSGTVADGGRPTTTLAFASATTTTRGAATASGTPPQAATDETTDTSPTTVPAVTTMPAATADQPAGIRGRLAVYHSLAIDIFTLDGDGRPTLQHHQDGLAAWTDIVGLGGDLLHFYRSEDALNMFSWVEEDGFVADRDAHDEMTAGFTDIVDLEAGAGRTFYYRAVDGHSGSILTDANGMVLDEDGYGTNLPAGYDSLAAIGDGMCLVYRSSDGNAIVVQPRASDVLVERGGYNLGAGWQTLVGLDSGLVVELDSLGKGKVLRATAAGVTALGSLDLGRGYSRAMPITGGLVVHEPLDGAGAVLVIDSDGRVQRSTPFTTRQGAIVAAIF